MYWLKGKSCEFGNNQQNTDDGRGWNWFSWSWAKFFSGFQAKLPAAASNSHKKPHPEKKIHFPLTQCTSLGFFTPDLHPQHRGAELEEPRQPWKPKPSPGQVIYAQSWARRWMLGAALQQCHSQIIFDLIHATQGSGCADPWLLTLRPWLFWLEELQLLSVLW